MGTAGKILKSYTYILFDWDGCLAKTLDIWLAAYKKTFAEYDLHPEDRLITQKVFGDWQGPAKLGIRDMDAYNRKLLAQVTQGYKTLTLYDHAETVLQELKKRQKTMALITSSKRYMVMPVLERLNLVSLFDSILTAEDVTKHKPDPEVIEKTLLKLRATKDASIFVGDTKDDIAGARNAGIDSLLFYPPHNELFYDKELLLSFKPTLVVRNLGEILEIIR